MIRALLVDDERPAIDRLKKLLARFSDIDVVGDSQDGLSALSEIDRKNPDVVFLDIDMPELNGLEVAKTLGVNGPLVIFITAYDEHALTAFESNAIDYVVKPVNPTRLEFTIEKVRKTLAKGANFSRNAGIANLPLKGAANRLAVRIGAKFEVFDPNSISLLTAQDHYTTLYLEGRELLSDDSLDTILARLDPSLFIRVHRSSILNIKYLKELRRDGDRKYTAILSDARQSQVLVSRERLGFLKAALGID